MSVTVEHEKRKKEILEKALDVFVDEGYADTTFQKIADRCGITRTILYLYFKNKREIFTFSIKRFTEKLETELREATASDTEPSYVKLERVSTLVVQRCVEQAKLLSVIADYLAHIRRSGSDAYERVRRRTIRMRHIVSGIVISGQKRGELIKVPVGIVSDFVYGQIEAAVFRATVLGRPDADDLVAVCRFFIERLKA